MTSAAGDLDALRVELASREAPAILPALAYTSPEVLAWELRHVFAGTWSCPGRLDELLPAGKTQAAVAVGDVGALRPPARRTARRRRPTARPTGAGRRPGGP